MKRLVLVFLALATPSFGQQDQLTVPNAIVTFPQLITHLLVIWDWSGHDPLVSIKADGTLEYGKNYTPDAAAKLFWEAMAAEASRVCK